MVWDYAEPNVFAMGAGDFGTSLGSLVKVFTAFPDGIPGQVRQRDATQGQLEGSWLFSTDPPYYDNIGYADLSDFFYVWLRRTIGSIYPEICSTLLVPKKQELVATPYRFDGSKSNEPRSSSKMGSAELLQGCAPDQHPDFPMTVFYAFKQTESDEQVMKTVMPAWLLPGGKPC